jgi:hypothetical protein
VAGPARHGMCGRGSGTSRGSLRGLVLGPAAAGREQLVAGQPAVEGAEDAARISRGLPLWCGLWTSQSVIVVAASVPSWATDRRLCIPLPAWPGVDEQDQNVLSASFRGTLCWWQCAFSDLGQASIRCWVCQGDRRTQHHAADAEQSLRDGSDRHWPPLTPGRLLDGCYGFTVHLGPEPADAAGP